MAVVAPALRVLRSAAVIEVRERYTDALDRAAQIEQEQRDDALEEQRRKMTSGKSALRCTDCNERIPPARRKAVPGVQTCIECQEASEKFSKRGMG